MSEHGARVLTDQIKAKVAVVWDLVCEAYRHRAWEALGYSSWDEYCNREFGSSRIRIPREEREEIVTGMRAAGMSVRAISSATGAARNTVRKDVAQFDPPAEVVGLDGKTYSPPSRPSDDVVDVEVIEERETERAKAREEALTQRYSGMFQAIEKLAGFSDHEDTEWIMSEFGPEKLSPTDLYQVIDRAEDAVRFLNEFIEWRDAGLRAEQPWRYAIGEPDEIQRANGDASFQSFKAYADVYCLGLKGEPRKRMQSYLRELLKEMENGDV